MSQSEDTVEFSKKKKKNDKEKGRKKKRRKKKNPVVPSFNYKGNRIQREFNLNVIEDMEVLIPLIQKGVISRATRAVKNMIKDLQKRNKLIKIAGKSPAG